MKHWSNNRVWMSLRGTLLLTVVVLGMVGIPRPHVVSADTKLAVQAAASCPVGRKCFYFPNVASQTSPVVVKSGGGDLSIAGIEVTQAVQDTRNSVPLVAGRSTMLRVYTGLSGANQPVSNIKVSVSATNGSNVPLTSSPAVVTATVPLQSSRADYGSSINFPLPEAWTAGTVNITVRLDPYNQIAEANKDNNSFTQRLVFTSMPTLRVMVVPIAYHNTANGRTYPAPTKDTISDWMRRVYPVSQISLAWHAPYTFTGNLSTQADFTRLLNEITTLRSSEKASASLGYYGLIPTTDGTSTWFNGGIAGVGWVGLRAAIGLDLAGKSSQIAAHEIGHNLGMQHTPCGGAAGVDPSYPYSDGSIGQYGLDIATGVLYQPGSKDVMSYCDPKWISDYTYKILFNNQSQVTGNLELSIADQDPNNSLPRRGLLVRAHIFPDRVDLLPAYVLPKQILGSPEAGDYQVQVIGLHGEQLLQTQVRAYEAGDSDEQQMAGINAMIPLPDQPAARVRLLKDGQVLAEQPLQVITLAKVSGMTVDQTESGYQLRWAASQTPVMLRYTTDSGQTWSTLAVDMQGGQMEVPNTVLPAPGGTFDLIEAGLWK